MLFDHPGGERHRDSQVHHTEYCRDVQSPPDIYDYYLGKWRQISRRKHGQFTTDFHSSQKSKRNPTTFMEMFNFLLFRKHSPSTVRWRPRPLSFLGKIWFWKIGEKFAHRDGFQFYKKKFCLRMDNETWNIIIARKQLKIFLQEKSWSENILQYRPTILQF